jgi:hypothetical protein
VSDAVAHGTGTAPFRGWSYEQAAERSGIPLDWLKRNIATIPHRRYGRCVRFTDQDLAEITEMRRQGPSAGTAFTPVASAMPTPSRRRGRQRAGGVA